MPRVSANFTDGAQKWSSRKGGEKGFCSLSWLLIFLCGLFGRLACWLLSLYCCFASKIFRLPRVEEQARLVLQILFQ